MADGGDAMADFRVLLLWSTVTAGIAVQYLKSLYIVIVGPPKLSP